MRHSFRLIQDNTENSKYVIDGERAASAIFSTKIIVQGNKRKVHCLVGRLAKNNHMFVFTFTADSSKFDSVLSKAEYMIESVKIYQ